jgi:hypothetical protein
MEYINAGGTVMEGVILVLVLNVLIYVVAKLAAQ